MLHASTERSTLCKRKFMQRGRGTECLVRQLVGVAVCHKLKLCLVWLADLLCTSAAQRGRGQLHIWEWLGVLLSLKLTSAGCYHGFCLLPLSAVSFLRSGTKLIFRRRSKQKEVGLSQSHDDLSNVTANSTTRKKTGSFSHRLIKRFSFKSKSKPKGSDSTSACENWRSPLERFLRNRFLVSCLPTLWLSLWLAVWFFPTLAEGRHPSALRYLGSRGGKPRT